MKDRSQHSPAPSPSHVTSPPTRPLLIWDGDCSFCRRWIMRWQRITGGKIDYEPYQSAADRFPQLPKEGFGQAVHLIEPNGAVTRAAAAVFRSLALGGRFRWLWSLYRSVPLFAWGCELAYRMVARNRNLLDKVERIFIRGG